MNLLKFISLFYHQVAVNRLRKRFWQGDKGALWQGLEHLFKVVKLRKELGLAPLDEDEEVFP